MLVSEALALLDQVWWLEELRIGESSDVLPARTQNFLVGNFFRRSPSKFWRGRIYTASRILSKNST